MVDEVAELNLRYRECYVSFEDSKGVNHPFYIHEINNDMEAYGHDKIETEDIRKNVDDLNFSFPKLGCINMSDSVILLIKHPFKQYKKGLYADVISIIDPIRSMTELINRKVPIIGDSKLLKSLYNKEYYDPLESLHHIINHEKLASAFSDKYFFSQSIAHPNPLLYLKDELIGWVEDDVCYLNKNFHPLYEELSEMITTVKAE